MIGYPPSVSAFGSAGGCGRKWAAHEDAVGKAPQKTKEEGPDYAKARGR